MQIILASTSPRRIEICKEFGVDFKTIAPTSDEPLPNIGDNIYEWILLTALEKAKSVQNIIGDNANELILAADTTVILPCESGEFFYKNERVKLLCKPSDEEDAIKMLSDLSGKKHYVLTAVALFKGDKMHSYVEETAVFFKRLSADDILSYVSSGEPMGKAGAYAIQGEGSKLIKRVDGDYYNVVGLPKNFVTAVAVFANGE